MKSKRVLFDITMSLQMYKQNAIGVLRIEREICKAVLKYADNVEFFAYDKNTDSLLAISYNVGATVVGFDLADPNTKPPVAENEKMSFRDGDLIIAAGFVWEYNYFDKIKQLKTSINLRLYGVVYDLIAVLFPEFMYKNYDKFKKYIYDLSDVADAIYCISESALNDLRQYLVDHNKFVPDLRRIGLGSEIVGPAADEPVIPQLAAELEPGKFIICVCTIEPRKNHTTLFNVWRHLYHHARENLVPLVIVGKIGWNTDNFLRSVVMCNYLYPEHIKIFNSVDDIGLEWLYRNCLFSVYPSHYEGWGLPVSESLAYGKFCLASSSSSMPESSAGLTELIDPLDQKKWIDRIEHYLKNPEDITKWENYIKENYKPIQWDESMKVFVESL